jgi:hypothetical protein
MNGIADNAVEGRGMKQSLSHEGALSYLEATDASYHLGLITRTHFLDRLFALSMMCRPDDPTKGFAKHVLRMENWTNPDEWAYLEGGLPTPQHIESALRESTIDEEDGPEDGDFDPFLYFTPDASIGLSNCIFHQYDPDYFPSVPHGHYTQTQRHKLDAYLGWIYNGSKQIGREPKYKIVALWNDDKFRTFALIAIDYYQTHFPKYRWRVRNPRRLPRRR